MSYKEYFNIKNITFVILVIALLFILPKISAILMLFFGAYVLACALNPYVSKLTTKMKRGIASTIVVLTSILSIIALFVPIFFVAFKEIRTFMLTLPQKISGAADYFIHAQFYGHKLTDLLDIEALLGNSASFAQNIVNKSLNLTFGIFQILVILIILTMIVYYILLDKNYLKEKYLQFFPPDMKNKAAEILSAISNKVGTYVRTQMLSMFAVGVMVTFAMFILKVEYSTLLGLISGVLDIIPILGPSIALGVILLVAYPFGLAKLIMIVLAFLIVQQISNYVVRPVLFGKMMSLHPLMLFLALFVADQFLGFCGVILSPAIAATVCVLIDELYLEPINMKADNDN